MVAVLYTASQTGHSEAARLSLNRVSARDGAGGPSQVKKSTRLLSAMHAYMFKTHMHACVLTYLHVYFLHEDT